MNLRALLSSVLVQLGLAASVTSLVASPALAQSAVTSVRADACLDRDGLGVEWLDAANDAYDALPDTDERISLAQVLEPRFDGPRPFHEPSGFDTTTVATWDFTRFVADDVTATTTVAEGKRDSSVLKLAGHAVYGMGKQVLVLTVGSAIGELEDWYEDPLNYYADRIPGIAQVKQVWSAPETIPAYYEMATTLVPAKWNEFLAAKDYEQAQMIGATAATVGVFLAPMSKGTGSAAADAWVGKWSKLKNDALTSHLKNVKDPRTFPLRHADVPKPAPSLSDEAQKAALSKSAPTPRVLATPAPTPRAAAASAATPRVAATPAPTPRVAATPASTPRVVATPAPTPIRRIAVGKTDGLLSKNTSDIPHSSTKTLVPHEELRARFPKDKLSDSEMRAMLADERDGRQILATNEKKTRELVGQSKRPDGTDPATADYVLRGRAENGIIPVETKAQNEVNLIDEGSSALSKFEAMSKGTNAANIEHFEIRIRTDTRLPGDFMVEPATGRLWRRLGTNDYYEPWEVGGKAIFVKRAALGEVK